MRARRKPANDHVALFRVPRQRLAQVCRGAAHVGNALLVAGFERVEVAAAEVTIHLVEPNKLAAAAAEAQRRRDAADSAMDGTRSGTCGAAASTTISNSP